MFGTFSEPSRVVSFPSWSYRLKINLSAAISLLKELLCVDGEDLIDCVVDHFVPDWPMLELARIFRSEAVHCLNRFLEELIWLVPKSQDLLSIVLQFGEVEVFICGFVRIEQLDYFFSSFGSVLLVVHDDVTILRWRDGGADCSERGGGFDQEEGLTFIE